MVDVKQIKARSILPPKNSTPQCSKTFDYSDFGEQYVIRRQARCDKHGWVMDQCCNSSSYKIEGKHYCTTHAGQAALKLIAEPMEPSQ